MEERSELIEAINANRERANNVINPSKDRLKVIHYINIPGSIKIAYARMFDNRFAGIIDALRCQAKYRNETSLRISVKFLLKHFSAPAWRTFEKFIGKLLIDLNSNIDFHFAYILEPLMKLAFDMLYSMSDNIDEYLTTHLSITNRTEQGNRLESNIQSTFCLLAEELDEFEREFNEKYNLNDDEMLSDEQKSFHEYSVLMEKYIKYFEEHCPEHDIDNLRKTIAYIFKKISPELYEGFFGLCQKLITKHADSIQKKLKRYIPIDIFLMDIYQLIDRLSGSDGSFWFQRGDDTSWVEREFQKIYNVEIMEKIKVSCSDCGGEVFRIKR